MTWSHLTVAILGGAPGTLGGHSGFGILLGEEHRCSPADFVCWGGGGIGAKAWNEVEALV